MTSDTVAFIRERLDEDEQGARAAGNRYLIQWSVKRLKHPLCQYEARVEAGLNVRITAETNPLSCDATALAGHIARHDPARVLRGVEAKRRIVEAVLGWGHQRLYDGLDENTGPYPCSRDGAICECGVLDQQLDVLYPLASEHATHSDYRQGWAP